MAEIGRWSGLKFEVKSGLVRGFTGLTIKGSVETEDKESNSIKYVANKARKPTEVSLTVHLDARLGADVRDTAMNLISKSTYGAEDYFYIANKKLVPYKMKLTEASVNEVQMNSKGVWICCDVKMTMKQSSLPDGSGGTAAPTSGGKSGGGGGGGSQKVSTKTTSTSTNKTTSIVSTIVNGVKNVATKVVNGVKNAVTTVKNVLTGKTSVASAVTSAVKAGVSAVAKVTAAAKAVSTATKSSTSTTAKSKITSVVTKVKSVLKK